MRGFGGLLILGVLLVAAYFAWTQLGGDVSGSAPDVGRPDVEVPDPNEAADKARRGLDKAADTVMGLNQATWTMILIALGAGYLAWLWYSRPKFKWSVIGGLIMLVVIIAVVPQFR